MDDLISRSALKEEFKKCEIRYTEPTIYYRGVYQVIDNAPTVETFTKDEYEGAYLRGYVDSAKANERPKGEWIEGENGNIKCNQCESEIRYSYLIGNKPDFPKFCPNCGADMRTKENNK